MSARVLVVFLDAFETSVLDTADDGSRFPALRALRARGMEVPLASSIGLLPGVIWTEIATGRSAARLGPVWHTGQIHPGEATLRPVTKDEIHAEQQFWVTAGRHGHVVAAIDIPQAVVVPGLGGAQLTDWGAHDVTFAPSSDPPELLPEILDRYGYHPVRPPSVRPDEPEFLLPSDVLNASGPSGLHRLLDALDEGLLTKTWMVCDLLDRRHWDLFITNFSEGHSAGHHLWGYRDPSSAFHDVGAPQRFRDAIDDVYDALDAALGQVMDHAGPDATILVASSHGMGNYVGGPLLLPEVLHRLGYGPRAGALTRLPDRLPRPLRAAFYRLAPESVKLRHGTRLGYQPQLDLTLRSTRAAAMPHGFCGGIRLNLAGREPHGQVRSGAEARELLDDIRAALFELEDPRSGRRIITFAVHADDVFGTDRNPAVPDLVCGFEPELAPITACWSERVGDVEAPLWQRADAAPDSLPRTGDHNPRARLWAAGPAISVNGASAAEVDLQAPGGHVLDIAPTILGLLDVPLPEDLDGRPIALTGVGVTR